MLILKYQFSGIEEISYELQGLFNHPEFKCMGNMSELYNSYSFDPKFINHSYVSWEFEFTVLRDSQYSIWMAWPCLSSSISRFDCNVKLDRLLLFLDQHSWHWHDIKVSPLSSMTNFDHETFCWHFLCWSLSAISNIRCMFKKYRIKTEAISTKSQTFWLDLEYADCIPTPVEW